MVIIIFRMYSPQESQDPKNMCGTCIISKKENAFRHYNLQWLIVALEPKCWRKNSNLKKISFSIEVGISSNLYLWKKW